MIDYDLLFEVFHSIDQFVDYILHWLISMDFFYSSRLMMFVEVMVLAVPFYVQFLLIDQ
jgi:hypothetical protein